jgi:molybdopterin molybdotransferase
VIDFDEAVRLTLACALPLGAETVRIEDAHDRVLAQPVIAGVDAPPADVSAMDGWAVREADFATVPTALKIIGESFPGAPFTGRIEAGQCVRLFTGSAIPDGADRVVIQEVVERDGDVARFARAPDGPRHIRKRGGDFQSGETLLPAGRRLDPRALVAAAGADLAGVSVVRRPGVIVLGTGDELAEPGQAHSIPGAIPESVSFGVAALARQYGATVLARWRLQDDLAVLERAAGGALDQADVVIVTGGASVGEKDFARVMFAPHGLELVFAKVAIKPGKPVWLGRAKGKLVIGLPGNPTSALVTARLFLAPLLAGLSGGDASGTAQWRDLPLANPLGATGDRETFHRAALTEGAARILNDQDSGAQRALAAADLLVRRRAGAGALDAGEVVETLAF